jgi:hypothetical protein
MDLYGGMAVRITRQTMFAHCNFGENGNKNGWYLSGMFSRVSSNELYPYKVKAIFCLQPNRTDSDEP